MVFTLSKSIQTNRKQRQSNIELLRIVAMFLVLVVHADFFSNGTPTTEECSSAIAPSVTRFFIEAISIVCVDVFVFISGWFGIRPSVKRMSSFLFQCFFFLAGLYAISVAFGFGKLSISGLLGCFALLKLNWFIKAYVGLCIFAPFLNSFIENSNEKQLGIIIFWFFVFQSIYGWLFDAAAFIEQGYSVFSFVGLYLLAQYIRRYMMRRLDTIPGWKFAFVYLGIALFNTIWGYLNIRFGLPLFHCIFSYISPLVIVASISLFMAFHRLNLQSMIVNWVAASSFAVFLFHVSPAMIFAFFKENCNNIYNNYDGVMCLSVMFVFLISVFCISILLDQIRIMAWNRLSGFCNKHLIIFRNAKSV